MTFTHLPHLTRRTLLAAWATSATAPWATTALADIKTAVTTPTTAEVTAEATAAVTPKVTANVATEATEVEAGVYMLQGARGEPDATNGGRIGNAGFIVGRSGVVVIDTGTSWRHGEAVMQAVAQVTKQPIKLAIVTHTRQEFLFGAAAFQARGIPVQMHEAAARLMAARCEGCLKTLQRELGAEVMAGTRMFEPDERFTESHAMDMIGRPVLVQHHGHSSGPGDVSVFDVRTGTLFGGGLVDQGRIPDVQDSDLAGWKTALNGLRTLRIQTVVPGHGPMTSPDVIGHTGRYLVQLEARVAELLRNGVALSEVADATDLPEFRRWDQYATIHRRNASIVFLRQEQSALLGTTLTGVQR